MASKRDRQFGDRFKQVDEFILNLNQELGRGSYGLVFEAIDTIKGNKKVAVKQISQSQFGRNPEPLIQLLKKEITNMRQIKHPNVVELLDVRRSSNNVYIIFEYCNGGSLESYLQARGTPFPEQEALAITGQIVAGFQSLHAQKIVHRDLKLGNILLHNDLVKIADFGFSKALEPHQSLTNASLVSEVGSPLYMSPQIYNYEKYSSKVDVWSLGIMLFEMLYGRPPWRGNSPYELKLNINSQELVFPESPKVTESTKHLLRMLLSKDEENRLGWERLFELFIEKEHTPLEEKLGEYENNLQEEIPSAKTREPAAGRRVQK